MGNIDRRLLSYSEKVRETAHILRNGINEDVFFLDCQIDTIDFMVECFEKLADKMEKDAKGDS